MSTIYATGRAAGATEAERCTYYIASQLSGYLDPVPPGRMSVAERDALAAKLGQRWADKIARGETSCAWHEVSEHYGSKCPCAACRPDIRRFA